MNRNNKSLHEALKVTQINYVLLKRNAILKITFLARWRSNSFFYFCTKLSKPDIFRKIDWRRRSGGDSAVAKKGVGGERGYFFFLIFNTVALKNQIWSGSAAYFVQLNYNATIARKIVKNLWS